MLEKILIKLNLNFMRLQLDFLFIKIDRKVSNNQELSSLINRLKNHNISYLNVHRLQKELDLII
jgi:hypothetical protein